MALFKIELVVEASDFVTQADVLSAVWYSDLPYKLVENIAYQIDDYDECEIESEDDKQARLDNRPKLDNG